MTAAIEPAAGLLAAALLVVCAVAVAAASAVRERRLRAALRHARRRASRDDLTGAMTRPAFLSLLEQWLGHADRREPVAVLAVDLDDFGQVNKRSGHRQGDRVLARAAGRLQAAAGEAVAVARVGGDEFLVLAPERRAEAIAERIVRAVADAPIEGHRVGASVGIALAQRHPGDGEGLIGAADAALRTAKRSGKGRVELADGRAATPADRAAVEALWREDRIRVAVQPIVGLDSGAVRAYEALARFDAPGGDAPLLWFDAAERAGLRLDLELACLRAALACFGGRPAGTALSVNASPALLGTDAARRALEELGDLHGLVVEITEESIVEDYDRLLAHLEPLLQRGLEIAVDDLGAGHATMRHVTALRPRFLKLDRSLVRAVDHDRAAAALVDALLGFAQRTDALLVAEGVEREAQAVALRRLGVPLAQGFWLGRPGPPWPLARPRPAVVGADTGADLAVVDRSLTTEGAHERFAAQPDLQALVVVDDDGRVLGLLTRHRLLVTLGRRYGFALYAAKSVLAVADRRCLLVPAGLTHERLVARAMGRDHTTRYDPVLVIDDSGRLLARHTIQDLLEGDARQAGARPHAA